LTLLILALSVLLFLKILQPVVRFRLLVVGFHRFGHLALEPEVFLSQEKSASKCTIDLWSLGKSGASANSYLALKWSRVLNVQPSWIIGALQRAGDLVPRLKLDQPRLSIHGPGNALDGTEPNLIFSFDEHEDGRRQMKLMGLDHRRPIVCLIVRDGGHYRSLGDRESTGFSFLNFDISNFKETAESLASLGYQVVRMGAGTERPMDLDTSDVFDYAVSEFRNEFMDVYLAGTCSFAISTQTGPDAVCLAFRRPVYYVDVTRFSQFFFGTEIAYWNPVKILVDGKSLSMKEILNSPIFWLKDPDDFLRYGVEVVQTSPKELAEMSVAFAQHASGGFKETDQGGRVNSVLHQILREGMGKKGEEIFGLPTAPLNPAYIIRHAEQFLQ
jgi:putative glycosyltransferase (TIGR04372 family)